MKSCLLVLAIAISLFNQNLFASECRVKMHSGEFSNAFGEVGYTAAVKILKKKGYTLYNDEDAEFNLLSKQPFSSSLWDMWAPISRRWIFSSQNDGASTVIESGTITGKSFLSSQRSMVRKLKKALKQQLPECQQT